MTVNKKLNNTSIIQEQIGKYNVNNLYSNIKNEKNLLEAER